MTNNNVDEKVCCQPFDPKLWEEKEITWKEKLFVTDHITSFLHIPLNMGGKIVKNMALIEKANAKAPYQLMLTDEKSLWGADIYIDVVKKVPSAQMAPLSGNFLTKVFEGPYQKVGTWAQTMKKYVERKGKKIQKLYFSYTTCPHMCQGIRQELCRAFRADMKINAIWHLANKMPKNPRRD